MYKTSYVYNEQLASLPVYDEACKRMMSALERKLQKENLTEKYNECVKDFFNRGVLQFSDLLPNLKDYQKSYIPLTYALKEAGKKKIKDLRKQQL